MRMAVSASHANHLIYLNVMPREGELNFYKFSLDKTVIELVELWS